MLFLSFRMPSWMFRASVITIACEMRCPWNLRYERAHLVYLVLSREACLAAYACVPKPELWANFHNIT